MSKANRLISTSIQNWNLGLTDKVEHPKLLTDRWKNHTIEEDKMKKWNIQPISE